MKKSINTVLVDDGVIILIMVAGDRLAVGQFSTLLITKDQAFKYRIRFLPSITDV